ncbi:hypothetical protein A1QO_07820 [Vibrio genomosp. F10 str. ZF-129]|uniref:Type 4 fimbrial biogenesis protein PilX N-terminal domain-containing protein n=1 Tax=Vibrio genomosp. F10 str. ZF-129 TaxID=1187848 RepID=A0A1E5BF47_9VIBR|nr:hypothetical protein [Vibrio genomosp. F10]OEE34418.1 hypothetical protein A1QO_07820 [Vibrio genomosp. F10 str. ZF-129]
MRKNQQGAAALVVTALLLVGALAFALSSYRGVFYQIKVANNQIDARIAHWRAEGGLECGFSAIVLNNSSTIPTNLNTVCSAMGLAHLKATDDDPERLSAKFGHREVSKSITFSGDSGSGAIKSTSDLIIYGSTLVSPPDPGVRNSDNEYECIAVVVSHSLLASAGILNHGVGSAIPKSSVGFDNSSDCAGNHKTSTSLKAGIWRDASSNYVSFNAGNDLQRNETLNPFKAEFDFERGDWEKVRDHSDYGFMSYTMLGSDVDCVQQFKDDLVRGQANKVWIDGSCELNQAAINEITDIQSAHSGTYLFLLVHNGVFAIRGSGSIKGVIFHFNENFQPDPTYWDRFSTETVADLNANFTVPIQTVYGESTLLTPKHATFLQSGSFKFAGGMMFDTQGQMALFYDSMRLQYNSDITSSFVFSTKPKWKKGSWNDH